MGSLGEAVALGPTVAVRSEQATEHCASDPEPLFPVLKVTVSCLLWKVKLSGPDIWQNLEENTFKHQCSGELHYLWFPRER